MLLSKLELLLRLWSKLMWVNATLIDFYINVTALAATTLLSLHGQTQISSLLTVVEEVYVVGREGEGDDNVVWESKCSILFN
ncbi:hypothetical protein V2J09_016771 [Rumex salicifolius]